MMLINNINLFLIVLDAGKAKYKVLAESVCHRAPWFTDGCTLAVISCGGKDKAAVWASFIRAQRLYSQRAHPLGSSLWS